ncbi:SDR family NAD(P)-dependent oxidoreductase [Aminobacter aminovorans]|uniref:Levodione reductase n=1 Tax=Aminobacter aminovorans TaxID=83263 RepID=A0AAC8YW99_AMIAI|nr:SDR family oxidoreductase [Aminobacter aminovorans]AMS45504.1 Levodione reductase [Aminobacter aminovorans]MBB3708579.1 NAD(P)-dependent dehydrogenase (short-subunit alcohol dehydrogenase family) [Aminobacter aminovorans]
MARLSGKAAIVTGAASGIGAAVARRFASEGASVILADRDGDGLAKLASDIREGGGRAITHTCDVTDETHMDDLVSLSRREFGRIDIGVLNAGTEGKIAPIEELEVGDFDRVIAVNKRSVFIGLKGLFHSFDHELGGAIVVTASTAALRGNRGLCPYAASKHAVLGLVRTAALERGPKRIRVNAVCPGPVDTPMVSAIAGQADPNDPNPLSKSVVAGVPLGRMAAADELASMFAFLANPDASYCNGGVFVVDGGATAGPYRAL